MLKSYQWVSNDVLDLLGCRRMMSTYVKFDGRMSGTSPVYLVCLVHLVGVV
jgi:hypothetical protein